MRVSLSLRIIGLLVVALGSITASSKIWQGVIVRVDGTVVVIDPHYTPYASATLYPKYCDTADGEGDLLTIDLSTVHVPFIDDVPALPAEFLAAAQPGMRVVAFMNRKQWHQVMLCVRDADTAVGYVEQVAEGTIHLRRPQADWPAQMSNRESFGADRFPDRQFTVSIAQDAIGLRKGEAVAPANLLQAGAAVMVLPARPARLEVIPDPAARWHAEQEPLVGNYGEYEHRSNPRIDEQFYRGCATGWFTDAELTRRSVRNRPGSDPKDSDTWLLHVPYGDHAGEHVLPTRGHKTKAIIAGHFNSFPRFDGIASGRRVTAWTYRTQLAPNWLIFDGQEALVEGAITDINGDTLVIESYLPGATDPVSIDLDDDTQLVRLGINAARSQLQVGTVVRYYAARSTTIIAGR